MLFSGEKAAIKRMLADAETYGYGNFMAHLATAWQRKLMTSGLSEETAKKAVSNREPYPLDWDWEDEG